MNLFAKQTDLENELTVTWVRRNIYRVWNWHVILKRNNQQVKYITKDWYPKYKKNVYNSYFLNPKFFK